MIVWVTKIDKEMFFSISGGNKNTPQYLSNKDFFKKHRITNLIPASGSNYEIKIDNEKQKYYIELSNFYNPEINLFNDEKKQSLYIYDGKETSKNNNSYDVIKRKNTYFHKQNEYYNAYGLPNSAWNVLFNNFRKTLENKKNIISNVIYGDYEVNEDTYNQNITLKGKGLPIKYSSTNFYKKALICSTGGIIDLRGLKVETIQINNDEINREKLKGMYIDNFVKKIIWSGARIKAKNITEVIQCEKNNCLEKIEFEFCNLSIDSIKTNQYPMLRDLHFKKVEAFKSKEIECENINNLIIAGFEDRGYYNDEEKYGKKEKNIIGSIKCKKIDIANANVEKIYANICEVSDVDCQNVNIGELKVTNGNNNIKGKIGFAKIKYRYISGEGFKINIDIKTKDEKMPKYFLEDDNDNKNIYNLKINGQKINEKHFLLKKEENYSSWSGNNPAELVNDGWRF